MDIAIFSPYQDLAAALLPQVVVADDAGAKPDGAHDLAHLRRVWNNVRRIQVGEGGDLRLLLAAVLLHDCVQVEKDSPLRAQASTLSAQQARTILAQLDWQAEDIDAVAHAIEAHSFSAGIAPRSLEAGILQDADRLDAIGAIGVARCFYTAGRMGSSLHAPVDPLGQQRPLDDRRYALDHFPAKLFGLAESFQTATGGMLAGQREARMRSFVESFLEEC